MQILFLLVGLTGLTMFLFGSRILLKRINNKIAQELTAGKNEVCFNKPGLYAVSVIGGFYTSNNGDFNIRIHNNNHEVSLIENQLNFKSFIKSKRSTELYQFKIKETGIYTITFNCIEDLNVKKSMLSSKRLFEGKVDNTNITIAITETISIMYYIIGLLMTVFGFNIAGWGIILALNPHLIK